MSKLYTGKFIKTSFLSALIFIFAALFLFAAPGKESARDTIPDISRVRVEYKAGHLKDPFGQRTTKFGRAMLTGRKTSFKDEGAQPPKLIIKGIVSGGDVPQAIINETIVKPGDRLGSIEIANITKAGVSVIFENRKYDFSSPVAAYLLQSRPSPKEEINEK